MYSDTAQKLMNNYVFQNRFRKYFYNNFEDVLQSLSPISNIDKAKSTPFFIEGIFGLKRRIINFPNIFSYAYSISKIDSLNLSDFGKLASSNNKMQIDFDERKFKSNSYSSFLEERLNLLISDYDKLYKIDIHSYYKSIYTHVFEKLSDTNLKKIDEYIRVFNNKKTNGLLLGNLLSTFSANEIMEELTNDLQKKLSKSKIFYFSDQFYIFYNELDYEDNEIYNEVSRTIGRDYFELKINSEDSKIYNHEQLLTSRNFLKKVSELVHIQKSSHKDIDKDLENLLHFFNAFIEEYYQISENNRLSFIEVVLKSVFSSPVNLYRLSRYFTKCEELQDVYKIISILVFFLKRHPSLIIFYVEIGLWDIINKYSDYMYFKGDELREYFEKKLITNINTIEAVYYFHICYLLKNKNKRDYCLKFYKNNAGKNLLLDSIIVETCNIKENKNVVLNYRYDDENWLINYTKFLQIRYYIKENNSSNCLIKTINKCKKSKIKIVKSFDKIIFDEFRQIEFENIKEKFEKKESLENRYEYEPDYVDYF
ncbi:MAG: hypothetical protein IK997_01340 [Bacilli bacterium]|nr:hypothetical protein [Bacilli bacterium]